MSSQYLPINCLAGRLCGILWHQALGPQDSGLEQHHWRASYFRNQSSVSSLGAENDEEISLIQLGKYILLLSFSGYIYIQYDNALSSYSHFS